MRKSRRQLNTLLQTADELPQTLIRLSRRLQKGQFSLDLDLKRLDDLSHQLDRATNRLTMGIVTAALIIGSSIVMSVDKAPGFLGLTGYLLAFANSLWIIWSIWRFGQALSVRNTRHKPFKPVSDGLHVNKHQKTSNPANGILNPPPSPHIAALYTPKQRKTMP